MVLIAENIHIISKITKEALVERNDEYILNLVKEITKRNLDTVDLNIGPAKGAIAGSMKYLTNLILKNFNVKFSFDTSNFKEMEDGFCALNNSKLAENCFINSICADEKKIDSGFEIATKYNPNIVALAFNPEKGIAKTSEERLEYSFSIYEKAIETGIESDKLFFDPLVLPVCAAQNQANVVLETIRMLKEGMENIHTIIGLSNISNGCAKQVRPLLNRVFLVLAMGAGLDSAIIDGLDDETIRIYNVIKNNNAVNPVDALYCSLYNAISDFCDIDDVSYDKDDINQVNIITAARILTDKEIYSNSFLK